MPEGPEPAPTATDLDKSVDLATTEKRRSLFGRLNRTNRMAALVLSGIAAAFVAALIFGTGVLVGSEFGDSEGDRYVSDATDHGGGEQGGSDESEGDGGSRGNGGRDDGGESEADGYRGENAESRNDGDRVESGGRENTAARPVERSAETLTSA